MMNHGEFLSRVRALGVSASDPVRLAVVHATLRALATALDVDDRARLAESLPSEFASVVDLPAGVELPTVSSGGRLVDRLFARVAGDTALPLGRAVEAVQVVCRVVSEAVGPALRARLVHLPARDVGTLFELPAADADPIVSHARPGTLARGAPGSSHPISDSMPRPGQAGSVATWTPQRTARTLAGYRGPNDTLAIGHVGSRQSLARQSS